jgi:hypothetical protein
MNPHLPRNYEGRSDTNRGGGGAVLLVADMSCVGGGETVTTTTKPPGAQGGWGNREKFVADKGLGHSSFKKR